MTPESLLGILAGVCTTAAALPQLIKSLRTREVKGISPAMFMVLILGLSLWTVYGFIRGDIPLWVTNGISVLLNSSVLFLYYWYKKGKGK